MLITGLRYPREMLIYESLWETDPFYTLPDLSPRTNFIKPQCGRLIQGKETWEKLGKFASSS